MYVGDPDVAGAVDEGCSFSLAETMARLLVRGQLDSTRDRITYACVSVRLGDRPTRPEEIARWTRIQAPPHGT